MKIWLCGMVGGNREILEKTITPVVDYFDGLNLIVDSRAKPEDINWLEGIKKDGIILVDEWVNDHSYSSNTLLLKSGNMSFPDYFVWIDQSDMLNPVFAKDIRESVNYWHKNNVGLVNLDHPFAVRYHDGIRFQGNPHWGIANTIGKVVNLSQINGFLKESYVFNTRDTLRSGFLNPIKYTFEYPAFSNHFQLLYSQFGPEIHQYHEYKRINFRLSCKHELGIELTVEGLKTYMRNNLGNYPLWFEQMIEFEVNIKDAFRLFVLEQEWQKLAENRHNWSYFKWKESGEIDQSRYGEFVGVWNQYKLQKGELPE